jgi:hypothetical protein
VQIRQNNGIGLFYDYGTSSCYVYEKLKI